MLQGWPQNSTLASLCWAYASFSQSQKHQEPTPPPTLGDCRLGDFHHSMQGEFRKEAHWVTDKECTMTNKMKRSVKTYETGVKTRQGTQALSQPIQKGLSTSIQHKEWCTIHADTHTRHNNNNNNNHRPEPLATTKRRDGRLADWPSYCVT